MRYFIVQKQVKIQGLKVLFIKDSLNRLVFTLLFILIFLDITPKLLKLMHKITPFIADIQATLIDPTFPQEANLGEGIRIIISRTIENNQELGDAWKILQDFAKTLKQKNPKANIMLGDIFEI